ncbi:MAG TPA: 1-deoxy-D-xylulose-5-phosphate reductoisomerase, partial [candidate division Zixibacteria bacterium]|nr:1-deoxy-D-xylulose-5-phosphate reductoisomerase [candidate division Zixibacteria bacterium]
MSDRPRNIALLGSTGSIGRSTLQVIDEHRDKFNVVALAAYSDVERIIEQIRVYRPKYVYLGDKAAYEFLKNESAAGGVEVVTGDEELNRIVADPEIDLVVNALVGARGLLASLTAVEKGKHLALANKESLVVGGPLFEEACERTGARILPIDSEHSAIWQCMAAGRDSEVRRLILTASGGPFRTLNKSELSRVTKEAALEHPTWKMGPKITIDSATLMNKGLELIEAVWLFSIPPEMVSIVVHPQSIVHSMVEYVDSSVVAQMSNPDMKLPINYALFWPERAPSNYGRLDFSEIGSLTFAPPDVEKFPAINLAYNAANLGGTAPAALNAANEVAVDAFLMERIGFTKITDVIEETLS